MRVVYLLLILSLTSSVRAQFSPDGGQSGSIAIHKDSIEWEGFATAIDLEVGWLDAADTSLGRTDFFVRDAGIGAPNFQVQPLGDGGRATATFASPFADQLGYDFVVFENGFPTSDTSGFFELAFVEVSSNGVDFFRFPNTSLTLEADASGAFAELDSRLIDGLAGRFSAPYGAPFDLADLAIDPLLDLNAVRNIRVIDVIGSPDPAFAKTDTDGMIIIDPYPTPFNAGGFDLEAIGIIRSSEPSSTSTPIALTNTTETIAVRKGGSVLHANAQTQWVDQLGKISHQGQLAPQTEGFYFLSAHGNRSTWTRVFVH